MAESARILHLEDSAEDVELARATLTQAGIPCEIRHADTRAAFVSALDDGLFDVVLSDFRLPDIDGLTALGMVRERDGDVPFILVSGTVGEDAAIAALTAGATDYVLKERLNRLVTCVQRALAENAGRRERAQAEHALRESEERYRSLVESIADWVWVCDADGILTFSNQAATLVTGYRPAELGGRSLFDFLHERDARTLKHDWPGPGDQYPATTRRLRWRHLDGQLRHLDVSLAPMAAGGDRHGGLRGVARDVTSHLLLEAQLRQAQKMEAIGTLAGGIAHDFNNALTTILGFSELVRDALDPADPLREDIQAVLQAAEHSAALTRQLLAFSRRQMMDAVILDLREVTRETERMLRRLIGENIDLSCVSDPDLGLIRADRGQIEQVLVNLAVNARDAMPDGGRLTVETRNVDHGADYVGRRPYAVEGPHVMLCVSDTGEGMDAAVLARIFEPFFTTKPKGKGTGLGLATVYGIVKQSDGQVEVYSEPGRGTTFKIYFPCVDASGAAADTRNPSSVGQPPEGRETILVVEDEEAVRTFAVRSLERLGYRVLACGSAEDALALIEGGQRPDLLLTDAVLPKLSGPDLARRLEDRLPALKVLFVSGYTDEAIVRLGLLTAREAFLQKPFGPVTLARKVRQILDSRPDGA